MLTYELRVGVTGHRDLTHAGEVVRGIERLLGRIDATLSHQTVVPVEWTVVSALACGADRLVAEAVMREKQGRLEVVTPFPVSGYAEDFPAGADREEFHGLLARATQVDELSGDRAATAAAYLRAGERIVDTCEIVVAVWDGRPSAGGGTGDVVAYAVQRDRVVLWVDAAHPDLPPRVIRSVTYGESGRLMDACHRTFPETAKGLSLGYHQQTRYCLDVAVPRAICSAAASTRREALMQAAEAAGLTRESVGGQLAAGVAEFARADALAGYYQRRHTWLAEGIPYLAAAAVTVAVGQVVFFAEQPMLILLEIATMALVLGLWWWGRRQAWHEKWLHDRYLAERLRAATFTTLIGVRPSPAKRDAPLQFYRGPRHWLAAAADGLARSMPTAAMPFESVRAFIVSQWLDDQRGHFVRRAAEKRRALHRRHRLGVGLFGLTLLMATLHFAGVGHPEEATAALYRVDSWVTFLALVLPAWAGAIHAATTQLELERLAERSAQMADALDSAVHRARNATSIDDLRDVCRQAARLMADENHEWWVLLSFQAPRLHV